MIASCRTVIHSSGIDGAGHRHQDYGQLDPVQPDPRQLARARHDEAPGRERRPHEQVDRLIRPDEGQRAAEVEVHGERCQPDGEVCREHRPPPARTP